MRLSDLIASPAPPENLAETILRALAVLKKRATTDSKLPGGVLNVAKGSYDDLKKASELLKNTAWKKFNMLPTENLQIKPTVSPIIQEIITKASPYIAATLARRPTKVIPAEPVELNPQMQTMLNLLRKVNPINRVGSYLGESEYKRLTAGQEPAGTTATKVGIKDIPQYTKLLIDKKKPPIQSLLTVMKNVNYPQITETKSFGDLAVKPTMRFGLDVALDPLTWIASGGHLALKGIKAAAGPESQIGKQVFEAFGEAYPRVAQMTAEVLQKIPLFKNIDPGKIYNSLRSPSSLLSPEFKNIMDNFKNKVNLFVLTALGRAKGWYALKDPDLKAKIGEAVYSGKYDVLKKQVEDMAAVGSPALAGLINPVKEIVDMARGFRSLQSMAGKAAVKAGLISEETFKANKQNYIRQFYRYYVDHIGFMNENPASGLKRMVAGSKIAGENRKVNYNLFKKKLKPEDFRSQAEYDEFQKLYGALGPENIGFSATRGSILTHTAARQKQMFGEIAEIPGMAKERLPESILRKITPGSNLAEKEAIAEAGSKKIKLGDFGQTSLIDIDGVEHIKIPKDKGFGALAGKWMPRAEGQTIVNIYKRKNIVLRGIENLTGIWKTMKVPYSTTAQSRNFFYSNPILMTLSGIDPVDSFYIATKTLTTYMDKGFNTPVGQIYLRLGGLGKTFINADITPIFKESHMLAKPGSAFWQGVKEKASLPGKAYSLLEHAGKMSIMEYWHKKGFSWKAAFNKAQETLFDYGDRSALIEAISKYAVPFITFPSKALPFVAKQTLRNPLRVLPAMAMRDIWNGYQSQKLGLSENDKKLIQERYGTWYLIVGGKPHKPIVIDLSYLIPGTDLSGGHEGRGPLSYISPVPIPQSFQPSAPLIIPPIELITNRSWYFDKPIAPETSIDTKDIGKYIKALKNKAPVNMVATKDVPDYLREMVKRGADPEKAAATILKNTKMGYSSNAIKTVLGNTKLANQLLYLLRSWGPASGFSPGSYQWNALSAAAKGEPTYSGRKITIGQALLQELLGLKFNELDLKQLKNISLNKKRGEIKEIIKKLIQLNKSASPDKDIQKTMRREQILNKIKEIREMRD